VKVVLREDVPKLGRRGEVVRVADGYGRNFLLPKKLAYPATPGMLKQMEVEARAGEAREARHRQDAEAFGERLREASPLHFRKKAGDGETLYGSVTNQEIAEALAEKGIRIDRRKLQIEAPIKRVGTHRVEAHLYKDVVVELVVEVEAED
jgi:large subunit ribosomal protein L9